MFKVMKSTSKTRSSHYPLSSTVNDKFWKSHHDNLYLSTQHNNKRHLEKKIQLKHFATTFRRLTKKNMILVYRNFFCP